MAFQVSPGVQVSEIDLTNVVPAVSSTTGAFAGQFKWGPVDEVRTVSDSKGLIDEFSTPLNTNAGAEDFYSAEAFLKYGSSLRVVRISNLCYSANAAGAGTSILKNEAEYTSTYKGGAQAGTVGAWVARYAGSLGNSVKVSLCASANAYFNDAVTTVGGAEAVGQTTISVAASNVFNIRDQVKFQGDDNFYRVLSKPDGTSITIEALNQPANTGLLVAQASGNNVDRYWEFHNLFDKVPGTSAGQVQAGGAADEVHVVVVDEDGVITGTSHEVLETHAFLSLASDAKGPDGKSNYYKDVIERESSWVWWSGHESTVISSATANVTHAASVSAAFLRPALPINKSLSGGSDGRVCTAGQKYGAWDTHFSDGDTSDISFLICGSTRTDNGSVGEGQDIVTDHNTIVNQGIQLAESRKDCMFIASPRKTSIVDVASESLQTSQVLQDYASVTSSSYAVLDSGWVYQYDRFNDKYCWVPGNGHTAGIMARSDLLRDPWFSPAGFSRGQYLGITKLAYNPKQASRDDLYRARINPIVTFPGQGTVLFGDKTALTIPSAFDRINVRRLFIVLEKAISQAAQAQLFEFNDAFTRAQFRSAVEPFLRDVKNRRGLVDFSVLCDETNNTDTVIDRNEFVCSIFVKPARSINYITLNFVAARSGVEFSEIYSAV